MKASATLCVLPCPTSKLKLLQKKATSKVAFFLFVLRLHRLLRLGRLNSHVVISK